MWNSVIQELKKTENSNIMRAFINPLFSVKESEEEIVIGCPSKQLIQYLEKNGIKEKIYQIAKDLFDPDIEIKFVVKAKELAEDMQPPLPLSEPVEIPKSKTARKSTHLLSDYTFSNFVSGPSNEAVYAASQLVSKNPGSNYNPLCIYGDSGLGKTHLLQSIGHGLIDKKLSVCCLSGQQFINEFVKSLSSNVRGEFRSNILKYDSLLIDDVQFLANAGASQDELFFLFNEFHSQKKQIAITSDKYPVELKNIDDRLKTRFSWGVVLEIKPPEFETRKAIVLKKAQLYNLKLESDVSDFIAQNIRNNVRELESALRTIQIMADLVGKAVIDRPFAENTLRERIKTRTDVTADYIIKITAAITDIKVRDITSAERSKKVSIARQIAMYLTKKYTKHTLSEIGDRFGGRNHATVIASIEKIEKIMLTDTTVKKMVERLEREIEEKGS